MAKPIICVYQDCVMCGDRGKVLKQFIEENDLEVRKVSFASEEGRELVHKAVFSHGVKTMPFFTDGKTFATSLQSFVEKPVKAKKTTKRGKK